MAQKSEVASFYEGRSVFVTGGSGFMGKVLLEKLLYSCPGIRTLYVLMRAKRGKLPQARIDEMFKLPMFERLRKERPQQMAKLVAVVGDVSLPGLGLSPGDTARLQKDVNIVFHCAATLKLEASLKDSIQMNLCGTWNVIQLCKGIKDLKILVHLSTAFCYPDLHELEEKIYPGPYDPHEIMRCARWMDDKTMDMISPSLLGCHPNTYTFTKRLAECLINESYPDLNAIIVRPSIVTPSYREPVPGWVDSLNGPIGVCVAAGKGVIRSMHCKPHHHSEVIAVDIAINALIAFASREGNRPEKPREIPVFNLTAGTAKSLTWGQVLEKGRTLVKEYPFEMTIWYPDGNIRTSWLMHTLCVIFFQFLPAYFIDFLMLIFRQKRFMVRIQWRIKQGMELLDYFTNREWFFKNDKFLALHKELNAVDREEFFTDVSQVDVDDYLKDGILGARQYCMKEPPSSLPRCRRNLKILWVVDKLWSVIFYVSLVWFLTSYSGTAKHLLDTSVRSLQSLPVLRGLNVQATGSVL